MSRSRLVNFLNDVKMEYEKARFVYKGRNNEKKTTRVHRGRSRIVASATEDLFAKYLCREFKNVHIFVDQCITLEGRQTESYYPDLVICKKKEEKNNFEILYMIDLKMDIGWIRNKYKDYMNKSKKICEKMNQATSLKGKKGDVEGEDKENYEFSINKKACYDVVVVSSRNAGKLESDLIKDSKNKNTNIWVLSTGGSLNQYKVKKDVEAENKTYETLIKKMQKVIKTKK